ncbi:hypothetical protein ACJZ2D_013953 [Fusarium nematophilum]
MASRVPVLTEEAPAPLGGLLSQAIVANGFAYTSGAIAENPATGKVVDGDIEEHTHHCIQNLGAILERCRVQPE